MVGSEIELPHQKWYQFSLREESAAQHSQPVEDLSGRPETGVRQGKPGSAAQALDARGAVHPVGLPQV